MSDYHHITSHHQIKVLRKLISDIQSFFFVVEKNLFAAFLKALVFWRIYKENNAFVSCLAISSTSTLSIIKTSDKLLGGKKYALGVKEIIPNLFVCCFISHIPNSVFCVLVIRVIFQFHHCNFSKRTSSKSKYNPNSTCIRNINSIRETDDYLLISQYHHYCFKLFFFLSISIQVNNIARKFITNKNKNFWVNH